MIDLAELEAKAQAATQGEWSVEPHGSARALYAGRNNERHGLRLFNLDDGDRNIAANAAYITAAQPRVVLELIECIRAAEAKAAEPVAWAAEGHLRDGSAVLRLPFLTHKDDAERYQRVAPEVTLRPLYAAPVDTAALQKRVRVLEEALRVALSCIEAQVNDDGGIDNCEIGDRLAYERAQKALGGQP